MVLIFFFQIQISDSVLQYFCKVEFSVFSCLFVNGDVDEELAVILAFLGSHLHPTPQPSSQAPYLPPFG